MTTTPVDGFLLSMAANLATDLLRSGAKHLASVAFGDAETRALQRAYSHAFAKMLAQVGTRLDQPTLEHVRELFQLFVRDSQSNQMLLDVALVGADLPLIELRQRFWGLGYDASTLLPFKFDSAMTSLILGLAEGLQREASNTANPLYNRVSLGRLTTLEMLLRQNQNDLSAATQSLQQLEKSLREITAPQDNTHDIVNRLLVDGDLQSALQIILQLPANLSALAADIRHDVRKTIQEEMSKQSATPKNDQPATGSAAPAKLKAFLCHSSNDKPAVRELYQRLLSDDVQPWMDEVDLLPGKDWKLEIKRAVRNSDVVIVCLSQGSVTKTGFAQKEIRIALDAAEERPEGKIYIIPALLEPCDVPDRLSEWQWVRLYEPDGYSKLLSALRALADEMGAQLPRQGTGSAGKEFKAKSSEYTTNIGTARNVIIGDNAHMTINEHTDDDSD